jgi:hypothetical protein
MAAMYSAPSVASSYGSAEGIFCAGVPAQKYLLLSVFIRVYPWLKKLRSIRRGDFDRGFGHGVGLSGKSFGRGLHG